MSYSPYIDSFLDMLAQTVTLAPFAGRDQYDDPTWGAAKTYHARVSAESQAIYGPAGEVIVSSTKIIMHPKALTGEVLTTLGTEPDSTKVTLPDGTTPRVLQIGAVMDEVGICYWLIRT